MDERGQFTFYRSFWEAVKGLPKKDRLPILESIIAYALDGMQPVGLSQSQGAFFLLVKPTLDASRKKAASGKQGGKTGKANSKQTVSKPEANGKHNASEKEKEKEKEKEIEIESEKDKEQSESAPFSGKLFTVFWDAYPRKIDRNGAWEAWKAISPNQEVAESILRSLEDWKQSGRWTDDGGRYIPNATKFLCDEYWKSSAPAPTQEKTPKGASGKLGAAELENIQRLLKEGSS